MAADAAADFLDLRDDLAGRQERFETGDGIQFVQRTAGDAQAAPGNHGHAEAKTGEQRRERERDFVADAPGGMFVHERARIFWKCQNIAGIAHGQGESACFLWIQAAKIDGHKHGSHLVIGNFSGSKFADETLDFNRRERLALAFRFDERKKVHGSADKFLRRNARVMPAKTEGVIDDGVDLHLARGVGHVVQVAFAGRAPVIDGRRHDAVLDGQAQALISTAPAAPSMWPVAPLVELTASFLRVLAKDGLDGLGFADVALRCGGAVGVDVRDVLGIAVRA